jgi:hypothetical protein
LLQVVVPEVEEDVLDDHQEEGEHVGADENKK